MYLYYWQNIILLLNRYHFLISLIHIEFAVKKLNGVKAVFHEPHPENETDKGAVKSAREFLKNAGIDK